MAGGALVVAAGGSLTRFGHQQYLYVAMSAGIALMFWGYLKTIQPAPAAASEPARELSRPLLEATPMNQTARAT